MRKQIALLLVLVLLVGLLPGCGSEKEGGIKIYYLNMEMTNFEGCSFAQFTVSLNLTTVH